MSSARQFSDLAVRAWRRAAGGLPAPDVPATEARGPVVARVAH